MAPGVDGAPLVRLGPGEARPLATGKDPAQVRVRLLYRCEDASAGDFFARMTPLGLGYINASLRAAGYDCAIGNMSAKSWGAVRDWLTKEKPDLVGITVYTFNRFECWKLAKLAKEVSPGCKVVVGGPHATPLATTILEQHPEVDVVALGEGEVTAVDLADAVRTGRPWSSVDGIVWRSPAGPVSTIPRAPIEDLDTLPHPSRHYAAFGVDRAAQLQYVLTSRGCPAVCTFCDSPMFWGRAVRYRSAEDVVRELKFLRDEMGLVYVSFRDDTFTADSERAIEICEAIRESELNLLWDCQSRVNCIDEPRLAALRRAGCGHIQYGVESGSQKILRALAKGISIERVQKAIADSREVGVIPSIYLITGVPGETWDDVEETLGVLEKIRANDGIVSKLSVYPGTGVWEEYRAAHGLDDAFWERDPRGSVWAREDRFGDKAQKAMLEKVHAVGAAGRFTPADFAAHRAKGGEAFTTDLHEGWYHEERGELAKAAGVYERLVKREPRNFWGYLKLGNVRRREGRAVDALPLYATVESIVPRYAGVHTVCGKAYLELNEGALARAAFEAALARDPDDVDAQEGVQLARTVRRSARAESKRPSREGRKPGDRTASFEPKPC